MHVESTDESIATVSPMPQGERPAPTDLPAAPHAVVVDHAHVPVLYQPRTRKGVTIFAAGVAVVLLAIFLIVHYSNRANEAKLEDNVRREAAAAVLVDAVQVHRGDPQKLFTLPGDARAFYETVIFARISGYVREWLVDIGDQVKKGETLATIETPELDAQLAAARAKLSSAQSEVKVNESYVALAKSTYDRWWNSPKGVVSDQEREEKKAQYDSGKSKLAAALQQVNTNQEEVNSLLALTKFKEVSAPYDGVITARHTDIGDLVTAGSTTNTSPLFTISQSNLIRVFVDVPQQALPNIFVGMHAYATAQELGARKFHGFVDRMASSLDLHTRTMRVEVLVPNGIRICPADFFFHPPSPLHPGMYLQLTFVTDPTDPPLCIPAAALAFSPRGPQVAVIDGEGRVRFRPITIARDLGDLVEVESGLKEGETVALNIGSQVVEGQNVDAHLIDLSTAPVRVARSAGPSGAKAAPER